MRRSNLLFAFGSAVTLIASTLAGGCGDDEETTTSVGPTTTGPTTSTTDATVTTGTTTTTTTTTTTGGSGGIGGSEGGAAGSGAMGGSGGMATGAAGGTSSGGAGGSGAMGGSSMGGASMGGSGGGISPASEAAYFFGDFVTDGTHQVGNASYPGPVVTPFSLDGLMAAVDIANGGVAVSPDGMTIAVAGRAVAMGPWVINLYNAAGTSTAVTLVNWSTSVHIVDPSDLKFSPDGQWLAYRADVTFNGGNELWVVPAAGGTPKRVSQAMNTADNDVAQYAWQPDVSGNLKYIAYRADPGTNDVISLFTVEITSNTPTPVDIVPEATTTMNVGSRVPQFDAAGDVYFVSDFEVDNLFRLYTASITGTGRVQVPGTILPNNMVAEASIGAIGMSPDGGTIAFAAEAPSVFNYQVYVLDLTTSTPVQVSAILPNQVFMQNRGPDFFLPIEWSPDGLLLAVSADWAVVQGDTLNDEFNPFVLPTSGAPGGVRLVKVSSAMDLDAVQIAFTSNSARVFIRGDLAAPNDTSLWSTDDFVTADQTPSSLLVQGVPASGDINGFAIAP